MRSIGITGTGSYVPPKVVTNFDLERFLDTSDEWITTKTGIRQRRIVEGDVCTSDLAVKASEGALRDAGISPEEVDMIILATSSPDVPLSATACIIQAKLGAVNAGAFDMNAVCSGFVHAVALGASLGATDDYENILVVGAETYSKILNWEDRTTCVYFGDGAGACVLREVEEGRGVLASYLRADGGGAGVIVIPAGGTRMPLSHELMDKGLQYFHMNGRAVWDFAIEAFPEAVLKVLEKCGLGVEDVDLIVPHQANINIIKHSMDSLGLPMDKAYTNLDRYGNIAGGSIPIALDEAVKQGRVEDGDLVVLVGYGGGLAWGANAIRWGE